MKLSDIRLWGLACLAGFIADHIRGIPVLFSMCGFALIAVIYYFLFVKK